MDLLQAVFSEDQEAAAGALERLCEVVKVSAAAEAVDGRTQLDIPEVRRAPTSLRMPARSLPA